MWFFRKKHTSLPKPCPKNSGKLPIGAIGHSEYTALYGRTNHRACRTEFFAANGGGALLWGVVVEDWQFALEVEVEGSAGAASSHPRSLAGRSGMGRKQNQARTGFVDRKPPPCSPYYLR